MAASLSSVCCAPVVTVTRRVENIYSAILCLVWIFPLLSVANLLHFACSSAYFLCTFLAFYTSTNVLTHQFIKQQNTIPQLKTLY